MSDRVKGLAKIERIRQTNGLVASMSVIDCIRAIRAAVVDPVGQNANWSSKESCAGGSRIWDMRYEGGPKFTLWGAAHPEHPLPAKISSWKEYFALGLSKRVQNFDFVALSVVAVSEIWGGPKFTLVGAAPPARYLAEKNFIPEKSTWCYLNVRKISTFYLS